MSKKGTGIMGFADYSQPIIRPGYNKAKTDQVIQNFRQNEKGYVAAINELDEKLQITTLQRDALRSMLNEYIERYKLDISDENFENDWDRHLTLNSKI